MRCIDDLCADDNGAWIHGGKVQYAVIQYIFEDGNEAPVLLPPHGNAKTATSNSYHRTQKSTLKEIRETEGKPKPVISKVYDEVGGILEATSKSELPCNHCQVYNMQRLSALCTPTGKAGPIFELIQQCKID